jgi:hypothetical protein
VLRFFPPKSLTLNQRVSGSSPERPTKKTWGRRVLSSPVFPRVVQSKSSSDCIVTKGCRPLRNSHAGKLVRRIVAGREFSGLGARLPTDLSSVANLKSASTLALDNDLAVLGHSSIWRTWRPATSTFSATSVAVFRHPRACTAKRICIGGCGRRLARGRNRVRAFCPFYHRLGVTRQRVRRSGGLPFGSGNHAVSERNKRCAHARNA